MKLTTLLLIIAIMAGCSNDTDSDPENSEALPEHLRSLENVTAIPENQAPSHSVEFTREIEIGEMFRRISPNIVDVDNQGRVFMADMQTPRINVYNSDGQLLQSVSREGRGPGELTIINRLNSDVDHLYVYDPSQRIIHFYNTDTFDFERSIIMDPANWSHIPDIRFVNTINKIDSGTLLVGFSVDDDREGRYRAYHRVDMDGNVDSNRLFEQELAGSYTFTNALGMAGGIQLPSTRETLMDIADDGTFISAWSEEILIRRHSINGDYESAVYIPYENRPLDPQDIIDIWGDVVRDAEYPETWPALEHLILDDENRIWAATFTDDNEQLDWWVIDATQKLQATFRWPADQSILHIKDGKLYTAETDEDDISRVVRYDMEFNPYTENQ